jgi:hypothetical protein
MAHWPLVAVWLERHRSAEALGHVRALLDPTQQRMSDALTGLLQDCLDGEQLPPARMTPLLASLLEAARPPGYL